MVKMVNQKFNTEIELKMSVLTIDYGANARESVAMVKFCDHSPWGKFQGIMVMDSAEVSK